MIVERYPELANLPLDEKRQLLNELCEDIASSDQDSPDPRIVKLLEDRWNAHQNDPVSAMTLEEFRRRIGKA